MQILTVYTSLYCNKFQSAAGGDRNYNHRFALADGYQTSKEKKKLREKNGKGMDWMGVQKKIQMNEQ